MENVRVQGEFLKSELEKLQENHSNVSNVRGMGLFCSFDLTSTEERDAVINKAFENKLILLSCGEKTIRFRPHLNVKREDLEKVSEILNEIL